MVKADGVQQPPEGGAPRAAAGGRLVVVSNRVAAPGAAAAGGLAVAVEAAMGTRGGLWFGWSGALDDGAAEAPPALARDGRVTYATVGLTPDEEAGYYRGYANGVLWPVLHYRTDLAAPDSALYRIYEAVNARFAEALLPLLGSGDTIWVHDYHLIPLARALRASGARQRIGFFLHVPFPAPEVMASIPEAASLIAALGAYDLVGFQTRRDAANAVRAASEHGDATFAAKARAFPIGIDTGAFEAVAAGAYAEVAAAWRSGDAEQSDQVIGVDRLDYSKGLPERLRALDRFLELYPAWRGRMRLLQIAPPTRTGVEAYDAIRAQLEGQVGAINGRYGTFDWTPVRYLHQAVPRHQLAGLYRMSRAALVTPLRDGMNLVAKEYVAAQDPADPGVLVLSRFAGAAEDMGEALIVNPHDADSTAAAIASALEMPLDERRRRHGALLARIRTGDVHAWARRFQRALAAAAPAAPSPAATAATGTTAAA